MISLLMFCGRQSDVVIPSYCFLITMELILMSKTAFVFAF